MDRISRRTGSMIAVIPDAVPRVSAELLARHTKAGPRYTSYPTAPEFSEAFDEPAYRARLAIANQSPREPLSIYVHLPFCESMCTFCGCHVIISKKKERFDVYLDHLEKEVALVAACLPDRRGVAQLHLGGGTPTSLDERQLERCFSILTAAFAIEPGAEIALEIDPHVTTDGQLRLLRRLGFNRVSMGVQDFTPEVQKAVNRPQSVEETQRLYHLARDLGFQSINLDLIYGLPFQTPDTFQKTLDVVIAMHPDRVAVFNYAHVPWLRPHQRRIDEATLPAAADRFELFARALASFGGAGYLQIGMDHFALPTDDLAAALRERKLHRNFMGYITRPAPDQIGLGVSSIGDVAGAYAQNVKWLPEYYEAVSAGRIPVHRGFVLTPDDHVRRFVIHQLMCNFGVDKRETEQRFGVDWKSYFAEEVPAMAEHAAAGFIVEGMDRIDLTPVGRVFMRNVAMSFDKYLRRPRSNDKPLFSRTV